ncbi:Aluminum-activated malate transporter [Macleaya cordata]|uniref:Aluminum-activated malate transporter n=1 Tax=Macleaya cordata TaxID=56857 RepID=A0A200Q9N0_MACCD|nr:Aluminum-activated malate transporter [Macleaya cordata]
MEVGSASHEKAGLIARGWWWLMALPKNFMAKIVKVLNKIKNLAKDDPRRVIHSIKVGLALSLVSLFYYFRPLYDGFGDAAMWAVLTVVVVFEFSVGATLGKGINRGIATLLAGALGVGAHHLANLAGEKGEPILLGILVFILAATSTFTRFFPGVKARYDYGMVIFILTFSLVSVSGYRMEKILELAHQRLSTILIGGSTCVIISIFVCPVWAGEDLHKLVALNIEKLADFLEGFGGEYFGHEGNDGGDEGPAVVVTKDDKSSLQGYKSVLNSKASEESLANFARWEPCHGRFRFRHPWKQYLKIGVLTRQCAYQVEALNSCINSDTQTPPEFKKKIQEACTKMSFESGKALRELATGIRTMTHPNAAEIHLEVSKAAEDDLKTTLKTALLEDIDLLHVIPAATVASLLVEIIACTEKIAEAVNELSRLVKFKNIDPTVTPEKPQILHRGTVNPVLDTGSPAHVCITVSELPAADHSTPAQLPENANKTHEEPMKGRHNLEV